MISKTRILLLILFTCACTFVHAQVNLVLNGSFEKMDTCPYSGGIIRAARYWNTPDTSHVSPIPYAGSGCTPTYANFCATDANARIPHNAKFFQYPRTGNGLINSLMLDMRGDTNFITTGYYHREYAMGHLAGTLVAGRSYCVSFYAVMGNNAACAIDHIGAYFDDGSIDTNAHCGSTLSQYMPQVYATGIITDSLMWTRIQGNFTANGTEKYITIGNFADTAHTNKIFFGGTYTFYEIDDVSVIASDAHADAGPDKVITAGDSTYIGVSDSNGDGMPCYWYVLGNNAPIDSGGTIKVKPGGTTTYVVSMDLCGSVTTDTVVVHVEWPVGSFGGLTMTGQQVEVWPNPTNGDLHVSNAAGSNVSVYDMVGKEVYHATLSSNSDVINLSFLKSGVYVVQIVDARGNRTTYKIIKQ